MEPKKLTGSEISVSDIPAALQEGYYVFQDEEGKLRKVIYTFGLNDYQQLAGRSAKELPAGERFWHGAQGAASDAGELLDISKANQFYGKPVDVTHAVEEIGDVLWFLAEACNGLGVPLSFAALCNLDKLRKRYPEKYSNELAIARLDKKESQE